MLELFKDLPIGTNSHNGLLHRIVSLTVPVDQLSGGAHQACESLMSKLQELGAKRDVLESFQTKWAWACVALHMEHVAAVTAATRPDDVAVLTEGVDWNDIGLDPAHSGCLRRWSGQTDGR